MESLTVQPVGAFNKTRARYVIPVIILLALLPTIYPGHATSRGSQTIQNDSLLMTVNPDRSVGIGWNTTTINPVYQNVSNILPQSGSIRVRASSNFTQTATSVVQTTTIQYQLPSFYSHLVNSIELSASQNGTSGHGALTINSDLPIQNVAIVYSTTPSQIQINATAHVQLSCYICPGPFANQDAFRQAWARTLANSSWTANVRYQIENATRNTLSVTVFNATETDSPTSASVAVRLVAVPSGSAVDFVAAFESLLSKTGMQFAGIDPIIRSILTLETDQSVTLSYLPSTGQLVIQIVTNYVSNLDARLNNLKSEFLQLLLSEWPLRLPVPTQLIFLNSTSITVSKISATSDIDLGTGVSTSTLRGLSISPLAEGSATNFTIPRLFQTLGTVPLSSPGINITLAGGLDSDTQVKIVVPPGTPAANSTTSNSATWFNVKNVSELQNVRFEFQAVSTATAAFLISPTGIAIEAVIVAGIAAVAVFYVRRRRKLSPPVPSDLNSAAGSGPGPASPGSLAT